MKYREVVIFSGHQFQVPEHIQRLDTRSTRAWQLRYGKWKIFSDHTTDGTGAAAALAAAVKELQHRIHRLPAPTGLRHEPNASKNNDLPAGISGPISRTRKGRRVAEYNFGVTIPRFGDRPTNVNVYIGTENTITDERTKRRSSRPLIFEQWPRGHIKLLLPKRSAPQISRMTTKRKHVRLSKTQNKAIKEYLAPSLRTRK